MKSIRIGNDISVQWLITHNGVPESLEGRKRIFLGRDVSIGLFCPIMFYNTIIS